MPARMMEAVRGGNVALLRTLFSASELSLVNIHKLSELCAMVGHAHIMLFLVQHKARLDHDDHSTLRLVAQYGRRDVLNIVMVWYTGYLAVCSGEQKNSLRRASQVAATLASRNGYHDIAASISSLVSSLKRQQPVAPQPVQSIPMAEPAVIPAALSVAKQQIMQLWQCNGTTSNAYDTMLAVWLFLAKLMPCGANDCPSGNAISGWTADLMAATKKDYDQVLLGVRRNFVKLANYNTDQRDVSRGIVHDIPPLLSIVLLCYRTDRQLICLVKPSMIEEHIGDRQSIAPLPQLLVDAPPSPNSPVPPTVICFTMPVFGWKRETALFSKVRIPASFAYRDEKYELLAVINNNNERVTATIAVRNNLFSLEDGYYHYDSAENQGKTVKPESSNVAGWGDVPDLCDFIPSVSNLKSLGERSARRGTYYPTTCLYTLK